MTDLSDIRVSLVIPTYNRGKLIAETLAAALAQRRPFEEIIVVDDGSTDDTSSVILSIGSPSIKFIRTENLGVQNARNVGARAASADWLVFCDSDDVLDMDYTLVMANWVRNRSTINLIYTNFSTFGARPFYPDKFFALPLGFLKDEYLDDGFYTDVPDLYIKEIRSPFTWPTGMMIRRQHYFDIGGFDIEFRGCATEDWEFHLRAIQSSNVALCRRVLARVRYHPESQSSNGIKVLMGARHTLGHALASHQAARPYAEEIAETISNHLRQAFDAAFASRNFLLALEVVRTPEFSVSALNHKAKIYIVKCPSPLRIFLWSGVTLGSRLMKDLLMKAHS